MSNEEIVEDFKALWYYESVEAHAKKMPLFWMGRQTQKCPMDLWVYQEILYENRPDLIVEAGTSLGASAHYLAMICDALDNGYVLTVDIEDSSKMGAKHKRIVYYQGDICAKKTFSYIDAFAKQACKTMFIFDDDHSTDHVLQEMEMYANMVTVGQYMIVEDTNHRRTSSSYIAIFAKTFGI